VATPIGNLEDMSPRAVRVLSSVSLIAAEDTRHSKRLLTHFGVGTRLTPLHDHNEKSVSGRIIRQLEQGRDVALISDAGTPLISDPGYTLVRAAHAAGIRVLPVPGPAALTAALSVAGLPTDRFFFEGFLPHRRTARRQRLTELQSLGITLVCYESSHRIAASLADMVECLGAGREATLARELTKAYETVRHDTLAGLLSWLAEDAQREKGEFVIMVKGITVDSTLLDAQARHILAVLLEALPLKQAAALAAKITGLSRNALYDHGLVLKQKDDSN
ncbi:MAG: 16S rRNA (cytidine(1402)-2'-O)-methyltransferase, partial [Thiohalobacterales bacterium]|nr:16S rRNA (cytidine(1402)-2'-O)-methyltransferase [Thiohalobacterales bacterium]